MLWMPRAWISTAIIKGKKVVHQFYQLKYNVDDLEFTCSFSIFAKRYIYIFF